MDGGAWWAAVHGVAKSRTRLSDFTFTFHFPALEKAMATHSSVFAWRIPGTGEPRGLPSMGSQSRTRLKQLSSSSSIVGETTEGLEWRLQLHLVILTAIMYTCSISETWQWYPKSCFGEMPRHSEIPAHTSLCCKLKSSQLEGNNIWAVIPSSESWGEITWETQLE